MSKAFTKESDGGFDEVVPEPRDPLPEGVKNYVTPEGADQLREELRRLEEVVRPEAVDASTDDADSRLDPRVAAIDRRIQFLRNRVHNMVLVDPATQEQDSVHFGATVSVADAEGHEKVYKIVGVDESEPASGKISFISPIAKALISAKEGDVVSLELPDGAIELEILEIRYE